MHHKFFKIALSLLLLGFFILGFFILLPRKYEVTQFQPRKGTLYWDLATGSRIGYTKIEAKGEIKPYPILYLQGSPGGPIFDSNIQTFAHFLA